MSIALAAPAQAAEPLKIGFLDTMTGANGNVGQLALEGAQIAVAQWNAKGGALGRKVELVVKDEELSPSKTVQDMRQYMSEGINLITGFTSSADVLAAKLIAEKNNAVIVTAGTTDNSLTTTQRSRHIFEVAANIHMMNAAAADMATTDWSAVTRWDGVNYDYLTGHDSWNEFAGLLKAKGKETGKAVFVPFSATQDTPFITSLLAANPNSKQTGLYYFLFGGGAVQFAKQALPLNLFSKYKIVAGVGAGEEISSALESEGPEMYFVHDYFYQAYNNPTNEAFIKAWEALPPSKGINLYGPHEWTYEGYTATTALLSAVEEAHSTKSGDVIEALEKIHFESPAGKVHFAPSHILYAPTVVWQCKGDAAAKYGYTCFGAKTVPPELTIGRSGLWYTGK